MVQFVVKKRHPEGRAPGKLKELKSRARDWNGRGKNQTPPESGSPRDITSSPGMSETEAGRRFSKLWRATPLGGSRGKRGAEFGKRGTKRQGKGRRVKQQEPPHIIPNDGGNERAVTGRK